MDNSIIQQETMREKKRQLAFILPCLYLILFLSLFMRKILKNDVMVARWKHTSSSLVRGIVSQTVQRQFDSTHTLDYYPSHRWSLSLLQQFHLCLSLPDVYVRLVIFLLIYFIGALGKQFYICPSGSQKDLLIYLPIYLAHLSSSNSDIQMDTAKRQSAEISEFHSTTACMKEIETSHSVSIFKGICFLIFQSLFGMSGAYGGNVLSRLKEEFTPVSDFLVAPVLVKIALNFVPQKSCLLFYITNTYYNLYCRSCLQKLDGFFFNAPFGTLAQSGSLHVSNVEENMLWLLQPEYICISRLIKTFFFR